MKSLLLVSLACFLFGCVSNSKSLPQNSTSTTSAYDDSWWMVVPEADVKPWEIPPHAADRSQNEVILSKRTELGIFSNLAATPFTLDGVEYASVEGLWQGMKYPENANDERFKNPEIKWPLTREQVYKMSGFESKEAGDLANEIMKKLGIKWVTYQGQKMEYKGSGQDAHYEIILAATVRKIQSNPKAKELLLRTRGLTLKLDHRQDANVPPAYRTDLILMKIRDQLGN